MNITVEIVDNEIAIVALPERLDALSAQDFRTTVKPYYDAGTNVFIVDLSATPFLDSAGMAALVSLLKQSRQSGGDVKLIWPEQEPVKRILQLTRFDRVFDIYDSRDAVLASVTDGTSELLQT